VWVIGCGWSYLSTVLDQFWRYILPWKLCIYHHDRPRWPPIRRAMACAVPGLTTFGFGIGCTK
jgi:hypothetical protein